MAGIYIHIPYCKQKCNYCDFHFSTQTKSVYNMVKAICKEIILKKHYLQTSEIETIYFGGGTPSFLTNKNLQLIIETIKQNFKLHKNIEFTIECNPDDLDKEKLIFLKSMGVNRLSIGIQSFNEFQLKFMNRAHNAQEALNSVKMAQQLEFNNITIDLIYGLPNTNLTYWKNQVKKAVELNVDHISAYCLTIEPKTAFGNWHKMGKFSPINDEVSLLQFQYLIDELKKKGFEQYEISNFARNNAFSKHNSAYWQGKHYVGIGPSAHSFNGKERQWNIANNYKYIRAINNDETYYETEILTKKDNFNERIMTRLRTKWGVDINELKEISHKSYLAIEMIIQKFIASKDLQKQDNIITLTPKGKFIADYITSELFII
ncbi:MAG TPA: radical SAM family heme chaperone HemW [Crocinitomix sp.]|nr:radical SAM family heme chaperone HemW [Crocinitomix sp.]